MRNYPNSRPNRMERDLRNEPDTDHYIPNYDRDGYVPGPRYGNKPEIVSNPAFGGPVAGGAGGVPGGAGPAGFPVMGKIKVDFKNRINCVVADPFFLKKRYDESSNGKSRLAWQV